MSKGRRNPVAKFASLFNKARRFKDRTKYNRRTKLWLKEEQREANELLGSEKSRPCETKQGISSKKLHKEDQGIPGSTTSTKDDNKKSTKVMEKLCIEGKDRCQLFKWEWKL